MRLRYQKRALKPIETALTFVAHRSPQGAAHIEASLSAAIGLISRHPHCGRKTPIPGVRRFYLTPYPYFFNYFAGEEEIVVQRFRHAARKPLSFEAR
ncbi:type II toxin-antitoxin system RelE/ParE family toxin [Aurantimonas sp. Leaf443]|uniref:type II toxin-antitoxin system RelE/ParE family toxin n=1 Tax=Aurantimonas sp. Leaf443 TaxID=1736378 RepID=UPI0006F61508|nr:type II toxin-antitoxin system RelE/ParE family toxin [Aurantimonas sp. Leaf443]KQT84005.1 hypothetical protein ASG48_11535 [Aurantimonas sp. Leaf443]